MASRLLVQNPRSCNLPYSYKNSLHLHLKDSNPNSNLSFSSKATGFPSLLSVISEVDYQSPRPYTPKLPQPSSYPYSIPSSPSEADSTTESAPKFWSYVFKPSVTPANYNTPIAYQSPAQYGPDDIVQTRSLDLKSTDLIEDIGNGGDEGSGGNDGNDGKGNGGSGGSGGSNDGNEEDNNEKESFESKKSRLTQSQKITLVYALLISFGGLVGFLTSGSVKSLIAGLGSAAILIFVFAALPSKPVLASCVGFAVSASLFDKMSSRYWKTNKFFPAGFIAVLSFLMSGGYAHGVVRGMNP